MGAKQSFGGQGTNLSTHFGETNALPHLPKSPRPAPKLLFP